jgi:hypothetical protein
VKEKAMIRIFLALVFVFSPFCLNAETFYIYTCEIINGELAVYPLMVKEGVLDALFETGHIAFDDGANNCEISLENVAQMNKLYQIAMEGGARFVVAVFAKSQKELLPNKLERVSSTAKYYLFDLKSMECVGQGEDTSSNVDKEATIKGDQVLFSLGQAISGRIERLFASFEVQGSVRKNRN